ARRHRPQQHQPAIIAYGDADLRPGMKGHGPVPVKVGSYILDKAKPNRTQHRHFAKSWHDMP
ncbi:hypothetical protein DFQ29_003972, partial [Apophysomyces sp. BC1021]